MFILLKVLLACRQKTDGPGTN